MNLRVTATGQRPRLRHARVGSGDLASATIVRAATIWRVNGALAEFETHRLLRDRLPIDEPLPSPAIIFQRDATVAVPPGWSAVATAAGPLMLTAPAAPDGPAETTAARPKAERR